MVDVVFIYDKVFSDKYIFNVMIGMNYIQDDIYKLKGIGLEVFMDYVFMLVFIKFDLQCIIFFLDKEVLVGFFVCVNYDYKCCYLLMVLVCYDGVF